MLHDDQQNEVRRVIFERKDPRRPVNAKAVIRNSRQGRIGGQVIDISENGCKLDLFGTAVERGQSVTIKLGDMESWAGTVRWVNGQIVGVQFHMPLHSAIVDHLSKRRLEVAFA